MFKKHLISQLLSVAFFLLISSQFYAQIPTGYYDSAAGLSGVALKNKLHDIISANTIELTYGGLWTAYPTTDERADGKVWDMYSDVPGGTSPYSYTFVTNQCGSYSAEGNCYNREHTVPASWFSDAAPMYTDLFHVVPTDGYVNNRRANYPYGKVATASWTSQNGSKLGSSATPGYVGTVFEPIDSFKGDFARIYFYMATRYKDELPSWTSDPFSGSDFAVWAKNLFLLWNAQDPVSAKEIDRNNNVYNIQNNRNPYVDNPQWINDVWGYPVGVIENETKQNVSVYPNPSNSSLTIDFNNNYTISKINIMQLDGKVVLTAVVAGNQLNMDVSTLANGIYFLTVQNEKGFSKEKIVVLR
jgi:endonuclease I